MTVDRWEPVAVCELEKRAAADISMKNNPVIDGDGAFRPTVSKALQRQDAI